MVMTQLRFVLQFTLYVCPALYSRFNGSMKLIIKWKKRALNFLKIAILLQRHISFDMIKTYIIEKYELYFIWKSSRYVYLTGWCIRLPDYFQTCFIVILLSCLDRVPGREIYPTFPKEYPAIYI